MCEVNFRKEKIKIRLVVFIIRAGQFETTYKPVVSKPYKNQFYFRK